MKQSGLQENETLLPVARLDRRKRADCGNTLHGSQHPKGEPDRPTHFLSPYLDWRQLCSVSQELIYRTLCTVNVLLSCVPRRHHPQGAVVARAHVTFTVDEVNAGQSDQPVRIALYADAADSSEPSSAVLGIRAPRNFFWAPKTYSLYEFSIQFFFGPR